MVEVGFGTSPHTELFDDLDEHGMTANGVTEDDFNFFDDVGAANDTKSDCVGLASNVEIMDLPITSQTPEASYIEGSSSQGVQPPYGESPARSHYNANSFMEGLGNSILSYFFPSC